MRYSLRNGSNKQSNKKCVASPLPRFRNTKDLGVDSGKTAQSQVSRPNKKKWEYMFKSFVASRFFDGLV